jgi:hypothetical protein
MKTTFPMIPASAAPLWFLGVFGALLLAVLLLFGYLAYSTRHVRFEVSPAGLRIRGDLFGRAIPFAHLDLDGARPVDLTLEPALAPVGRTMGTGLPGYAAGWFRLRGGGKALAFLTDHRRVLYLPTNQGYEVLLSVAEPEELLTALRVVGSLHGSPQPAGETKAVGSPRRWC